MTRSVIFCLKFYFKICYTHKSIFFNHIIICKINKGMFDNKNNSEKWFCNFCIIKVCLKT